MLYEPDNPAYHYRPQLSPALIAKQKANRALAELAKKRKGKRQVVALKGRVTDLEAQVSDARAEADWEHFVPYTEMDKIMLRVGVALKVSRRDLLSRRRFKKAALARQAVCYWAYRRTELSLPQIARKMGGRDHTTVLHSVRAYVAKRAAQGRTLRPARG